MIRIRKADSWRTQPIRTQKEVAKIMGISKTRVHQLERRAFAKLRKVLEETGERH